jgi:hypothetical protein
MSMCVILLHDRRNMTKDYEINQQNVTCFSSYDRLPLIPELSAGVGGLISREI